MADPARAIDVARFEDGDPPEVIRAAMTCSWCLRVVRPLTFLDDELGVVAFCDCPRCGLETWILLSWRQVAALTRVELDAEADEDADEG